MSIEVPKLELAAVDKTKEAFDSVKKSFTDLKSLASQLNGSFAGIAAGLTFTGVATGFTTMVNGAIVSMDALHRLNLQTGISVETLSALSPIAKQAGTDLDTVAGLVNKLQKNMLEFAQTGGGKAADAFAQLGYSQAQVADGLKNMDKFLPEFAKRLVETGVGGEQAGLAMQLLAKGGATALPFLKQLAESGALVAEVTTQQAEEAHKFEVSLAKLSSQSSAFARGIANNLLPALNDITARMLEARTAGEGFFGALLKGAQEATIQLFAPSLDGTLEKLKQVREEIARVRNSGTGLATSPYLNSLLLKESDLEKTRDRLAQLRKFSADLAEPVKPRGSLEDLPGKEKKGPTGPTPFEQALKALNAEKNAKDGLTRTEQLLADLQDKRYGVLSKQEEDQLIRIAARIDLGKMDVQTTKEAKEATDEYYKNQAANIKAEAEARNKAVAAIKDELDPTIELGKKLTEIAALEQGGFLTAEEAAAAATLRYEEYGKKLDEIAKKHDAVTSAVKENDRIFEQLSDAASAALGRIISGGESAGDAMRSIGKYIADLIVKITILEPLAENLRKIFKEMKDDGGGGVGGFFKSLFGGGKSAPAPDTGGGGGFPDELLGVFAGGTPYVPKTGLYHLDQGERVVTAAENRRGGNGGTTINVYPDLRGASAEALDGLTRFVQTLSASIEPRALNAVNQARLRGA